MWIFTKKKHGNLLTMRPMLAKRIMLGKSEDGISTIIIPRDSWLERLSVRYLRQPAAFRIKLDVLGSYVIARCTGTYTVAEIAEEIRQEFGEQAEPVLPRLSRFFQMIETNQWVTWRERE
ncbi:PqqD family protein [Brevibacillus laterosporus]|uniref:PqqD family protein n=1 Tax=Brevibacillus laterosporus TaxID=1465 RepID=A0AAP8QE98_BRELA|nr:PqqD family protein [Brevibacillus laterosporus]MED1662566.1 PqqD family peptide modification chaperone [Brevibacillus laterosporus]MED1667596.1 PqqD family peptide modification chaperone [Brevibacillus laterosporus]MED1718698.1 PqqD family peptide modification chaperone [Brevibacillus laterosporus]PPA89482.1 PqqD family protein [Brevibacillus laterosporus]PPB08420.1 PqqD family protein [Brevibacillus laterosporus]